MTDTSWVSVIERKDAEISELVARVATLEAEVRELRSVVAAYRRLAGRSPVGSTDPVGPARGED